MKKKLAFSKEKAFRIFTELRGFFKNFFLEFLSSCMGFSQKNIKKKLFFQNVLFQDKLEINEEKIRFFSEK